MLSKQFKYHLLGSDDWASQVYYQDKAATVSQANASECIVQNLTYGQFTVFI